MTNQSPEIFVHKNISLTLQCEPLSQYFEKFKNAPQFVFNDTGLSRGYLGKWGIIENKLFLIKLQAYSTQGTVGLDYLFPQKDIVFADWFSGDLILNVGEVLEYSSRLEPISYEKEIRINIKNGLIISQEIMTNPNRLFQNIDINKFLDNFVKEEIENSTIIELIDMFNIRFKEFSGKDYFNHRRLTIEKEDKNNVRIKLSDLLGYDKEKFFIQILRGINIYYFIISNQKSFPVVHFNSVMNAINGSDYVYINRNSLKWFSSNFKNLLSNLKIEFDDFPKKEMVEKVERNEFYRDDNWLSETAGTDDPEIMNDVYWNLD